MDLEAIRTFVVPRPVLHETTKYLQAAGEDGVEAWVLWAGKATKDRFTVTKATLPRQHASMISTQVDQSDLATFFDGLRAAGLHLGVQVHSHPGAAFHSATDNEHSIATQYGSLSIVVPDFCAMGLRSLKDCAVFRLGRMGWCGPLAARIVRALIEVTD